MTNFVVFSTVQDVLDEFVASNRTFTAYDITQETRKRVSQKFLHEEVKQFIHDKMAKNTSYTQRGHSVHQAIEYVPAARGGFVSKFKALVAPKNSVMTTAPVATSSYTPNQTQTVLSIPKGLKLKSVAKTSAVTLKPAPSKRLTIKKELIEKLGLTQGDIVNIFSYNNKIILMINRMGVVIKGKFLAQYIVDKSHNVRISPTVLKNAGLSGKVNASVENGKIILEQG